MMHTNGFPKSGNHALVKGLQLLGVPCEVQHIKYADRPAGPCVFIKRDPRNIICSWLRFNGKQVTPGMFLTAFRKFQEKSFVEELAAFEGYLSDPDTLVVRYEDLIDSATCLQGIADFVGVPYIEGAFEDLPGWTITWYADHSDFTSIWTPEIETAWNAEGGPELLARWGY